MERKKVADYIASHRLLAPGDKVLVALSGGADSVALLRLLLQMGYKCEAAHCNFHLRGMESDRDEAFVAHLCRELGVPLHTTHFDTTAHAARHHISIEMAARELRYQWFKEIKQTCGASAIAVAHHRDDSAETFLLNLIRGTGINGLQGIAPRNGDIVRPLLCLTRQEIIGYLSAIGQAYVTDSTNLQEEYTRNKIRLSLIPSMQEINPAVKENILHTAEHLREAALLYRKGIEKGMKRVRTDKGIRIAALLDEPAPHALLFEILSPLGFNSAQTDSIFRALQGQAGKTFTTSDWQVVKDRDTLLIAPLHAHTPPVLHMEEHTYTPSFIIPRDKNTACIDAGKIVGPMELRQWRPGDQFVPFGMKGRKKVSDYLTDRKFSRLQKEKQWVLCSGEEIVWLVGERTDNRFRIDAQTRKVIIITAEIPEKQ